MTATKPKTAATSDEQQIRDLIATWLRASAEGDLPTLLTLMSEDVVFLMAGQPPMRGRETFAAASQKMEGHIKMEGVSDVQEIKVFGDVAYCSTHLTITITPLLNGAPGAPKQHSGYTLSVLRKQTEGNWVLIRDANTMVMEK